MKRAITVTVALVTLLLTLALTSCGGKDIENRVFEGSSNIEISKPEYSLATVEHYDETGEWNLNPEAMKLDVDTEYYVNIKFDVLAYKDNSGKNVLDVTIKFDEVDIVDVQMQNLGTGKYAWESDKTDPDTGKKIDLIVMSFLVPNRKMEALTIDARIKLKPVKAGASHIILDFEYNKPDGSESDGGDPDEDYRIFGPGANGHTKNITVKRVKVEAPSLTVDEMGNMRWNHVKNAVQYKVYEMGSDTPLKNSNGEDIIIKADNFSVGSEMIYDIGQYIRDNHIIHIRAFSDNKSIDPSDYSNSVQHVW